MKNVFLITGEQLEQAIKGYYDNTLMGTGYFITELLINEQELYLVREREQTTV